MENFITSATFQYCIFPIGSALLSIMIKFATRNDRFTGFKKEDLAVGLELLLGGCLMVVLLTTQQAISLKSTQESLFQELAKTPTNALIVNELQNKIQRLSGKLAASGWIIMLMFLCLWSTSTIIRKWGWESDDALSPFLGIAFPLLIGIIVLIITMLVATQ